MHKQRSGRTVASIQNYLHSLFNLLTTLNMSTQLNNELSGLGVKMNREQR
jgi:hypothetical protein